MMIFVKADLTAVIRNVEATTLKVRRCCLFDLLASVAD